MELHICLDVCRCTTDAAVMHVCHASCYRSTTKKSIKKKNEREV